MSKSRSISKSKSMSMSRSVNVSKALLMMVLIFGVERCKGWLLLV